MGGPSPTGPVEVRWGDAGPSSPAAPLDFRPIVPIDGPYEPALAAGLAPGTLSIHGGLSRSGRLGVRLPAGTFSAAFRVDANHHGDGSALLVSGKRIFSDSEEWTLLDAKGQVLDSGSRGWGPAHLDPGRKRLYLPLHTSGLAAFQELNLKRGQSIFQTSVTGSTRSRLQLTTRVGKTYLAVVSDELRNPHGGPAPNATAVTTFEVGGKIDKNGFPRSQTQGSTLRLNRSAVQVALLDTLLVLAAEESLLFVKVGPLPGSLEIQAALTAPFSPQSLSVDEAGRAHLLVSISGKSELWVVDRQGRRLLREALGRPVRPVQPPVIGLDHRVFLVEADRITAVKAAGGIAWDHPAQKIAGASVTPDGLLLVAADREVIAFSADGSRRVVHTLEPAPGFPDEHLRTPPVVRADGTLLLGSTVAVIGLSPARH